MLSLLKQKKLLHRAELQLDENPMLALEAVQQLLNAGASRQSLLLLKARILVRCGRYLESAILLEQLATQDVGNLNLYTLWVNALLSAGAYSKLEKVLRNFGDLFGVTDFDFLNSIVTASRFVGEVESTKLLVEHMVTQFPERKGLVAQLGITYQSLGDIEKAQDCFKRAVADDNRGLNAYFLSYNNKWDVENNNIAALKENLNNDSSGGFDKALRFYALGKELEDIKQYEEAFSFYTHGAVIASKLFPYSIDADKNFFETVKGGFPAIHNAAIQGYEDDDPIFILGMPRTGSTLIDTIISSHSEVYSAGELLTFREVLKLFSGYPGGGKDLEKFYSNARNSKLDFAQIGEMYSTLARVSASQDKRFIDKLPMNHVLLGVIALALPNAKFIYSHRGPLDVCVSNYRQIFQAGFYPYSYDIEAIAHHYLMYKNLMDFWIKVFPERVLKVDYEKLVNNSEEEIRGIIEFCNLPWEDSCLIFHKTKKAVNTPSASQVREPIYRSSVEQWRRYESRLRPAIKVFEEAGVL